MASVGLIHEEETPAEVEDDEPLPLVSFCSLRLLRGEMFLC